MGAIQGLGCFSTTPVLNLDAKNWNSEQVPKPFLQCRLQDQSFPEVDFDDETTLMQKILCLFKLLFMCGCDLFKDEVQTKIERLQHSVSKSSRYDWLLKSSVWAIARVLVLTLRC